jgi:hypothetical protein
MGDWYSKMRERVKSGEDPIDLAVEKYDKIVNGEIPMGDSFDDCPLCVRFHDWGHETHECWECPVFQAGQGCLTPHTGDGSSTIFWQLASLSEEVDDCGGGERAVKRLHDFIRETVIPGLRKLNELQRQ